MMNNIEDLRNSAVRSLILTALISVCVAAVITYLVNRRRQTAGLAKATLFLSILGLTTLLPLLFAIPAGHLALRQIRRGGGVLKGKAQAWFGLVCGYALVLVLVGYGGAGVGYFSRMYHNTKAEEANIGEIEKAKNAWAAANGKQPGDVATASELGPFMPGGQFPPPSVEGEGYKINPLGVKATVIPPPPPEP